MTLPNDDKSFLTSYPELSKLVKLIDQYLANRHPKFFGSGALHPYLKVKRSKVIHDSLWGTNRFTWQELVLIDSPLIQRLRDIHQVGLAYLIYPSAHHTRFEHSLGVTIAATRILESIINRDDDILRDIHSEFPDSEYEKFLIQIKQELRLAALLHDTGHSLFSHSSEQVYKNLEIIKKASQELSDFVGKEKGAGEVISFCISLTDSVKNVLIKAKIQLVGKTFSDEYKEDIDMLNVALLIVGRSRHPYLQFLGDIISSGFDADKLDYLYRDAVTAGLPLRYDLDRYLYSVRIGKGELADGDNQLEKFYETVNKKKIDRNSPTEGIPYYETYRLRLPRQAMNTIEQIVICKMMLFSYIYHHKKVRAAEGLLIKILKQKLAQWENEEQSDEQKLEHFLDLTDSGLTSLNYFGKNDDLVKDYVYRLLNRLLPREVYRLSGALVSHAEKKLLVNFLTSLQDKDKRQNLIRELELEIGKELIKICNETVPAEEMLIKAGVWVDVPKAPKFEDVDELMKEDNLETLSLERLFPVERWNQAYMHYKYYVRIFSFSEYWEQTQEAAKRAMKSKLNINQEQFYETVKRNR